MNSRGDATRQLILATAEQLFAQRGIAATPLRDIGMAAGQKNHAAVQYHFGDRESLVSAIIAQRARSSEAIRLEMFADLMVRGQPQISDLVRTFVSPLAIHLDQDNYYLPFMSRYVLEYGGYSRLVRAGYSTIPSSTASAILSLLRRLLSDLSAEVIEERCMLMLTGMLHTLARYQAILASGEQLPLPLDTHVEDLVQFLTSGLAAPVGSATLRFQSARDSAGALSMERVSVLYGPHNPFTA
ncbi:TetR/AcrR family transcriptional regulator [Rhodococcus sp. NPDC003318]|uniref:TetR/AcrR family transcriptional regulator n=1 Tax=Rhodococcus sp. NPDC003318 TaxID=3364503 RepID=UPI00367A7C89